MTTIARATLALLLLAPAGTANAQSRAAADTGRELYQYWCASCHGRGSGNPGTIALQAKYGGKSPALLEDRTDLTAASCSFLCAARRLDHAVLSQDGSERCRPGCDRRVFDAAAGRLAISARPR